MICWNASLCMWFSCISDLISNCLKCFLLYSCAILLCSELSSWGIHLGMSCDHGIMFAAWVFVNREALLLNPVSYGTVNSLWVSKPLAPCGLRGCKNWPAPFPGRMSYKVTKLGLVFVLYLNMHYTVLLFIRAPFYVSLVFVAMCSVFWLFWLSFSTCQVIG